MQIILNRKSKYGNFDLVPTDGFVFSHHFIDYESKLLIVDETTIADSKKRNVPVPSYPRVIDPTIPKELTFEEYKRYFNYDEEILYSSDGKLKLITQRIHESDPETDGYEEQLFNAETGELISKGRGVAFYENKRQNLLEWHLEEEALEADFKKREDDKFTLTAYFDKYQDKIQVGDNLIVYYFNSYTFKLTKTENAFELYKGGKLKFNFRNEPYPMDYTHYKSFQTIKEFWNYLTSLFEWYSRFKVFSIDHPVMNALIIQSANQLRETLQLNFSQHDRLYSNWERYAHNDEIRDKEIKQYCPVCGTQVNYSPRYPKSICVECKCKVTDKDGRFVEYFNTVFGGFCCQGYYSGTDQKELYNSDICYIGNICLKAQEHRFGGIVIQKMDN